MKSQTDHARRPKSGQAAAVRARIVLRRKLPITGATVCKWRERFRQDRLEGLLDEPRGEPRERSPMLCPLTGRTGGPA